MATRALTEHAACAKAIRADLKLAFPTVRFTVRSSSFSMGDDVHVSWTDGPTTEQVEAITGTYQRGHFDGMIDLYEYSNRRDDIPQAKFVFARREYSRDAYAAAIAVVNRRYGWALRMHPEYVGYDRDSDGPRGNAPGYRSDEIYRTLVDLPLYCLSCLAATLPGDRFCPECGGALAAA